MKTSTTLIVSNVTSLTLELKNMKRIAGTIRYLKEQDVLPMQGVTEQGVEINKLVDRLDFLCAQAR